MLYKNQYRIDSIRLKNFDYSSPGAYFFTTVVKNRECLFGNITKGKMFLNAMGKEVETTWRDLPNHNANVALDEFIIMPNHVHGIIVILDDVEILVDVNDNIDINKNVNFNNDDNIDENDNENENENENVETGSEPVSTGTTAGTGTTAAEMGMGTRKMKKQGLPEIIRQFKTFSARRINAIRGLSGIPVWQSGYYEHIIRNEASLLRIRKYIRENPLKWKNDGEYFD